MTLGTVNISRQRRSGEFKAKVVLAALKGEKTVNEIAGAYGVHPTQIQQWKRETLEILPKSLSDKRGRKDKSQEELIAMLYQQIGQLKVELDWLKKKSALL